MSKTASTEEYIELRDNIIPILMRLHKQGSKRYWQMALYWYIGDAIKSRGSLIDEKVIPYDDVSHKEISRGQLRQERLEWRRLRNIVTLSKSLTVKDGKVVKRNAVFKMLELSIKYFFYKCVFFLKGYRKREKLKKMSRLYEDKNLASAIFHLPACYVEDFCYYYNIDLSMKKIVDTRSLKNGFSVAYSANIDRGKATALQQHGAFYGELKNHKGTDIEAELPDYFYTWGWSYAENQVPGEPKRLINFKDRYLNATPGRKRILLVMPSHVYERDLDFLKAIYTRLKLALIGYPEYEIIIRPRPSKVEKNNVDMLHAIKCHLDDEVIFDNFSDAAYSVRNSVLVICLTHPANMFMECLYTNHPVIAFTNGDVEYHPRYIEFVENLKNIGLIYDDINKFINFFEQNINCIEAWWLSLSENLGLKRYLTTYCGCYYLK